MNYLLKDENHLNFTNKEVPSVDFTGTWRNELGSTMQIQANTNGLLTGKYKTEVGRPQNWEEFELTGFASGDLISFSVNFGKYGSITGFTGQHTIKEPQEIIYTLWHMTVNANDEDENRKLWGSIWSGYNNFERISEY